MMPHTRVKVTRYIKIAIGDKVLRKRIEYTLPDCPECLTEDDVNALHYAYELKQRARIRHSILWESPLTKVAQAIRKV